MKTLTVNKRHEPYDRYIGRGDIMGNPFVIGPDGSREEVIAKYKEWAPRQPWWKDELVKVKGLRLGCFCKPKACHGDFIAEEADKC